MVGNRLKKVILRVFEKKSKEIAAEFVFIIFPPFDMFLPSITGVGYHRVSPRRIFNKFFSHYVKTQSAVRESGMCLISAAQEK